MSYVNFWILMCLVNFPIVIFLTCRTGPYIFIHLPYRPIYIHIYIYIYKYMYMYMYIYIYMYVCMYVCMYLCIYVCMYVCMYVYARSPPGLRAVSARSPRGLRAIPRDPARSPRDPARSCADCAFVDIDDTIIVLFMGLYCIREENPRIRIREYVSLGSQHPCDCLGCRSLSICRDPLESTMPPSRGL